MKNLVKYFIVLTLAVASFTSCIKEEFPTDVVTTEMIASSSTALQAAVAANNAWMTESMSVLDAHADFGFPGICMGLDALTSDVAVGPSYGYDAEFLRWRAVSTVSADGSAPYFIWKFFYTLIQNANGVLAGICGRYGNNCGDRVDRIQYNTIRALAYAGDDAPIIMYAL